MHLFHATWRCWEIHSFFCWFARGLLCFYKKGGLDAKNRGFGEPAPETYKKKLKSQSAGKSPDPENFAAIRNL